MAHEITPHGAAPAVAQHVDHQTTQPVPATQLSSTSDYGSSAEPMDNASGRVSRRTLWLWGAVAVAAICGVTLFFSMRGGAALRGSNGFDSAKGNESHGGAGIPVNTVRPLKTTLQRDLVLPGSIQPAAQAELYAKTSGYLRTIQRAPTPHIGADLVVEASSIAAPPVVRVCRVAAAAQLARWQAPQKDIGSPVREGEVLLEIDAPERLQDIVEKESLLIQRQAELEGARSALDTFAAAVPVVRAQKAQAEADVRKCEAEYAFRTMELNRLRELVKSRTITQEVADEKKYQVDGTVAAWESSRAKVQAAQAELTVVSSKLAAARVDLKVNEARVRVAGDALRQARILADYSYVRAPFDGIITFRGVDEGDFVQNASGGQTRRLMTITAIDKLKVVLNVPERDAPWVHVGTEAAVVMDARVGTEVKATVTRIAHVLDPQTRTMQAEIDLDNRDRQFLPGMYGQVTLILQKFPNAQAIPATALYSRKGENFVLLVQDGISRRQRVRIRYDDGKRVEVVKLLGSREVPMSGSEELIVSNKGEIADGQHVHTTLMNPSAATKPGGSVKEDKHEKAQQSLAPAPAVLSEDASGRAAGVLRLPPSLACPAAGGDSFRPAHRV